MHGTMRMYKRLLFLIMILLWAGTLFARGSGESAGEIVSHNNDWMLCISDLDVSALPSSRQILGGIILRTLVESLKGIEYRIRSPEEIQYYKDLAWSKSQSDAARALAAKQNERDLLVFRGDPSWRYQRTLQTYEADITGLEAQLRIAQTTAPVISGRPQIKVSNPLSPWPAPPPEGDEYRFCISQSADAFLSGKVTEFYGRIYVTLKLYTLYTNSYSWEEEILFSSEDLDNAISELGGRLNAVVSGVEPALLIVHAEPETAMIIIDDYWAGRGEVPLREHIPGTVQIAAHAEDHVSAQFEAEINAGEITELFISLAPLRLSVFTIDVPGSPGSSVFSGGLFLGKTPLPVDFIADRLSYISVETPSGETGSAVYEGSGVVRGSAQFIRSENTFSFSTIVPVSPEEKRVAAARNSFYSAYGRFWIALPVSLIAIGLSDSYINAYKYGPNPTMEMFNTANIWNYVKIGAFVVIGLAVIDTLYHVIRYLSTSGTDANPVAVHTEYSNTQYSVTEYPQ
jgi:hypothetical protein